MILLYFIWYNNTNNFVSLEIVWIPWQHPRWHCLNKLFDSFAKSNTSVIYLHLFVYYFPEVLTRVTGDLPSNMFSESNGGSQMNVRNTNGVKGKNGNLDKVQASIASKIIRLSFLS